MSKQLWRKDLNEADGLSITDSNWSQKRNNCVAFMIQHFSLTSSLLFMGKRWCLPQFEGQHCLRKVERSCNALSDACMFSKDFGVAYVSCERWFGAQKTEQITWDTRDTDVDRNQAHAVSFNNYDVVPSTVGHVLEIGSGPFTQSKTILKQRSASSITLVEPMALHYIPRASLLL